MSRPPRATAVALTPDRLRDALACFAAGVTVITTRVDGRPTGVTASSFTSVALEPPLVLVCLQKRVAAHAAILEQRTFVVNALGAGQIELGRRFAGLLPLEGDRFSDVPHQLAPTGDPLLTGCPAWVACRLRERHQGGDHTILVGEVVAAGVANAAPPLLYHQRQWCVGRPVESAHVAQGEAR